MGTHATRSPSKAARWLACPGSIREEEKYPDTSGPAAMDGTKTHAVLEYCLKGKFDPMKLIGMEFEYDES